MRKLSLFAALGALLLAAGWVHPDDADRDNPPIPSAEIRRITINIFPGDVIVVKGKMVKLADLREHLKNLVPDAKKAAVEVLVCPNSKKEMNRVAQIIVMARKLGYTNISYVSAKKTRPKITEITILLSRTGEILVDEDSVKEKELQEHLQKMVEEKRRAKVRVYVRASRLVGYKRIGKITAVCRKAGFKDIVFRIIAE